MEYNNPKSPKIKELIRIYFLSKPLQKTKTARDKVLDLGCGWGFYFKINPLAYGIDADKNCIDYLKSLGRKAIWANITKKLPFNNSSFEWVVCHDVLEHIEAFDLKNIFSEVHRILKPGGHFLVLIPNKKGFKSGIKRNVGHKHLPHPKELIALAENKFVTEKIYSYPFPELLGNYFVHNKKVFVFRKT